MNGKVLIVDDDLEIRNLISIYLENEGLEITKASDALEALELLEAHNYDLIILDIMMPKMDGIEACLKIREARNMPIIMLSAKSEDIDKIKGLVSGADDYLSKPFNPLELIARVKSQLRRYKKYNIETESNKSVIKIVDLTINTDTRQVWIKSSEVRLTPKEFDILELLARNKGIVLSVEKIYEAVWKENYFKSDNTVMVHIYYFIWITTVILTFIISLLVMIRRKIKYLQHITDSVQTIANGKLGTTIEIKGNDELSQLAKNINYMSKELKSKFEHERQIVSAKNELITNISHDLRTPLTSIIGYVDLLRKKEYRDDEQLYDYLETIYSKSQNFSKLINELFEYTKLTSPDLKLNFTEVELGGLLEQILGEYMPILEKEGLDIQKSITEEDIHVSMDIEKIVRVYDNLLMNVIKYSKKPSILKVDLHIVGIKAIFTISNQVENLPVQDVNKLFERFYRGDMARKEDGGSGIGLAISKRIIELHGGTIDANYREGWLTFTIENIIKE